MGGISRRRTRAEAAMRVARSQVLTHTHTHTHKKEAARPADSLSDGGREGIMERDRRNGTKAGGPSVCVDECTAMCVM